MNNFISLISLDSITVTLAYAFLFIAALAAVIEVTYNIEKMGD